MKHIIFFIFALLLFAPQCAARDFIVEFVDENYRETRQAFSYDPIIYHSIQVTSSSGPKLLVLNGKDTHYRNWLRQYIAQGKQFILHLPDELDDLFVSSRSFEADIKQIHPFNLNRFNPKNQKETYPQNQDHKQDSESNPVP